ncbi:MAG: hypothetical protein GY813_18955 [Halieaceae bacterium]|nr:hypothetical protein [Halieaceae bacterium]
MELTSSTSLASLAATYLAHNLAAKSLAALSSAALLAALDAAALAASTSLDNTALVVASAALATLGFDRLVKLSLLPLGYDIGCHGSDPAGGEWRTVLRNKMHELEVLPGVWIRRNGRE